MKGGLVCVAIIAALSGGADGSADQPGWFELPLPGGLSTLAAIGLTSGERAQTIALITRALYGQESRAVISAGRLTQLLGASDAAADSLAIPVPLSADAWQEILQLKRGEDLATRLLTERAATLVAFGLAATDPSVRELMARDRDLLRRIYRDTSGAFALAARSLRLEGGRVVVPGGETHYKAWESLSGVSPTRPEQFVAALLSKDGGRLAWYFDALTRAEPQRLALALPALRTLYESFREIDVRWRLEDHPFRRSPADPWLVLTQVDLANGTLTGPTAAWFWATLFSEKEVDRDELPGIPRIDTSRLSIAPLTRAITGESLRERRNRFELFRLAQRAFPSPRADELNDLLVALSGYRRYKAVLLSLERMGIRNAATWATLIEAARHVDRAEGDRIEALTAYQSAFALVVRMWRVGTVDAARAEELLRSLAGAVRAERRVPRVVARWIKTTFAATDDADNALLEALAGPAPKSPARVEWEGLTYHVNFAAAERDRLRRVRQVIEAPSLETALASDNEKTIADALRAMVYATALGDPEGPVTLSPDVATRHELGVGTTALMEDVWPWAPPIELQGTGSPWHVQGSLIGLDFALARLSMRHLAEEQMPTEPTLTNNDFATLARTVVAMVPPDLRDDDRDEIAAAIGRGRTRVIAAVRDRDALLALADEAKLPANVQQLLPWMLAHEPESLSALFSIRDLLWLGNPAVPSDRLDRWGMLAQAIDGRFTAVMPRAQAWDDFAGRADMGVMTTQVPDLVLRVTEESARLHVPAMLVAPMLECAVEDFWYQTRIRFSDDFDAMIQEAARLRPVRVEDYVAALAGTGPLRLPEPPR